VCPEEESRGGAVGDAVSSPKRTTIGEATNASPGGGYDGRVELGMSGCGGTRMESKDK
jgi:hypothetical protein